MIELILWIALPFVLLTGVGMALALRTAIGWSHEAIELQNYGVDATGRVIEKRRTTSNRNKSTWIRYEYVDQFGKTHRSRRNIVTPEAWAAHEEGGPIPIVYSQRKPSVSWPKYLLSLKQNK